jgi:hypothetical protein
VGPRRLHAAAGVPAFAYCTGLPVCPSAPSHAWQVLVSIQSLIFVPQPYFNEPGPPLAFRLLAWPHAARSVSSDASNLTTADSAQALRRRWTRTRARRPARTTTKVPACPHLRAIYMLCHRRRLTRRYPGTHAAARGAGASDRAQPALCRRHPHALQAAPHPHPRGACGPLVLQPFVHVVTHSAQAVSRWAADDPGAPLL